MILIGINTTTDILKLLYNVLSRATRQVKFETILKYHKWYLRQIVKIKKKKKCELLHLPTNHLGVHMNSFKRVRVFQIELEFGWFLRRGENGSAWRKTSRIKRENQQQTQPTYGVDARS